VHVVAGNVVSGWLPARAVALLEGRSS
jgi:hypothetical protein